ncbi:methyl-viologen-reducing hydrogenase delta subunit [Desulfobacca acetoxidans DSM 11109]|uniref:Methyl-viologen-reducing hydrogenase delta subunit n=2 Tax=Desulfobacca acetoxidans TaxID=60893 RepID=F2NGU0_DESAR|nr:methyl-viologen-reducing hydrogenase delta subunit [Desulfobacca acetoxidans DSM 11109]
MRLQYPANIEIIKVPCSGRVDIIHLLLAFEQGADGVIVAGCLEGDCHYQVGNLRARKRVQRVKEILDRVGLSGARLEMYNLSAGMGSRFAEIAREMNVRVLELGSSPIKIAREMAFGPNVEVTA